MPHLKRVLVRRCLEVPIEDYFKDAPPEEPKDGGRNGKPLSPFRPWRETLACRSMKDVRNDLEKIIGSCTELTVTYKEELVRTWGDSMLRTITEDLIKKVLKKERSYDLVLVGEHSSVGRYHMHGCFRGIPNDTVSKLKRALSRHIGRTEIKMLAFPDSYLKYMFKAYETYPPETWGEDRLIWLHACLHQAEAASNA